MNWTWYPATHGLWARLESARLSMWITAAGRLGEERSSPDQSILQRRRGREEGDIVIVGALHRPLIVQSVPGVAPSERIEEREERGRCREREKAKSAGRIKFGVDIAGVSMTWE